MTYKCINIVKAIARSWISFLCCVSNGLNIFFGKIKCTSYIKKLLNNFWVKYIYSSYRIKNVGYIY
jgi:hypothetical protein